jgi:LysM repeat protein
MKKYVVRPGDTLWKISKVTGVKLHLLMAANPQIQNPNQLHPGDVIVIPELGKGPGVPTPSPKAMPSSSAGQDGPVAGPYLGFVWPHVVKQGDTWASLAQQYHVPLEQIHSLNPLHQGRPLQPGEIIYVPMASSPLTTVPADEGPAAGGMMTGDAMVPPTAQPPWQVPVPGPQDAVEPVPFEPPGMGPHTHYPYRPAWRPLPWPGMVSPWPPYLRASVGVPMWAHGLPYAPMHPLPSAYFGPWSMADSGWWDESSSDEWSTWEADSDSSGDGTRGNAPAESAET